MNFLNKFTTQFKVFVAFILIVAAFVVLGFNQILLSKEVSVAVTTSTGALDAANQTYKKVNSLYITPTVEPTATPSAIRSTTRISTPASSKK